jgi:hypothetical protein
VRIQGSLLKPLDRRGWVSLLTLTDMIGKGYLFRQADEKNRISVDTFRGAWQFFLDAVVSTGEG